MPRKKTMTFQFNQEINSFFAVLILSLLTLFMLIGLSYLLSAQRWETRPLITAYELQQK